VRRDRTRGSQSFNGDPHHFNLLRLLLTRDPLFLCAFRSATVRFHLIHVLSRCTSYCASVANLILPLRMSCH
jgi:hypothetical protein